MVIEAIYCSPTREEVLFACQCWGEEGGREGGMESEFFSPNLCMYLSDHFFLKCPTLYLVVHGSGRTGATATSGMEGTNL